jgi:predicted nucleic acid-binding protein
MMLSANNSWQGNLVRLWPIDSLIAASALSANLSLVTRTESNFADSGVVIGKSWQ